MSEYALVMLFHRNYFDDVQRTLAIHKQTVSRNKPIRIVEVTTNDCEFVYLNLLPAHCTATLYYQDTI